MTPTAGLGAASRPTAGQGEGGCRVPLWGDRSTLHLRERQGSSSTPLVGRGWVLRAVAACGKGAQPAGGTGMLRDKWRHGELWEGEASARANCRLTIHPLCCWWPRSSCSRGCDTWSSKPHLPGGPWRRVRKGRAPWQQKCAKPHKNRPFFSGTNVAWGEKTPGKGVRIAIASESPRKRLRSGSEAPAAPANT